MLRNYLKIAFRNLWRHRVFSFINIMGLTVGMTACFLIFMYVRFELSYDTFHSMSNRIYCFVIDVKKYFTNEDPMGKSLLRTSDNYNSIVTGVMKDIPENSQIKADLLVSMTTITQKLSPGLDSQWGNYGNNTYFLLKPGAKAQALQ